MEKYILFGAGECGKNALKMLKRNEVEFFIDNQKEKQGEVFENFRVYSLQEAMKRIKNQQIVISVSEKYEKEIIEQLKENHIFRYKTFRELQTDLIKKKIAERTDYVFYYKRAMKWVLSNSIAGKGIINTTVFREPYPEVTGYYIPSLIRWGYRDLAVTYAKWLCEIQKLDGSWYDTEDKAPYIFDTAQILKGLLAVRESYPDVDAHILRGCDWILSKMTEAGRLITPTTAAWGDKDTCSELIHIYCLSPLTEAAKVFQRPDYKEKAERILNFYKKNYYEKIMNFSLLSHFYAYVMEGLLDMGEIEMVSAAMKKVEKKQKLSGAVPAYHNVNWVCTTGLFQFALVWFRLGNLKCGKKAFDYACKLQNESGGWYGSVVSEEEPEEINTYIPHAEISWAVKYFLDALYYKNYVEFDKQSAGFEEEIDEKDGRYQVVFQNLQECKGKGKKVLDLGCGKGRYLRHLERAMPYHQYYAVDLSEKVMSYLEIPDIEKHQGSLTNIPYKNEMFDMVYTCEALEHAVDIPSAIREMARVTKKGGKIVVVDKNIQKLGVIMIEDWEQWFDENQLLDIMRGFCSEVEIKKDLTAAGQGRDREGLFYAWIGKVKS